MTGDIAVGDRVRVVDARRTRELGIDGLTGTVTALTVFTATVEVETRIGTQAREILGSWLEPAPRTGQP